MKRDIRYGAPLIVWIATFCLQAGHELLHRDRDFDGFEKGMGSEGAAVRELQ